MAQQVKNLPAMQGTQVQSLGQEDPLDKRMATHSNILAWRIPWTAAYQASLVYHQLLEFTQTHVR